MPTVAHTYLTKIKSTLYTSIVIDAGEGHRMEFRKHKDGSLDIFNEFDKEEFLHLNKRQSLISKRPSNEC